MRIMRVFDWDKAAAIIKDRQPQWASAGLIEDWFWTGGTILEDGQIYPNGKPYLASPWATPTLVLNHDDGSTTNIPCWRFASEAPAEWDAQCYWPASARAIAFPQEQG